MRRVESLPGRLRTLSEPRRRRNGADLRHFLIFSFLFHLTHFGLFFYQIIRDLPPRHARQRGLSRDSP